LTFKALPQQSRSGVCIVRLKLCAVRAARVLASLWKNLFIQKRLQAFKCAQIEIQMALEQLKAWPLGLVGFALGIVVLRLGML